MAKKQTPITGQRLTPQEAVAMVKSQWATGQLDDDESVGDFLLLLHSIAYADSDEREDIIREIENLLMPLAPTFDRALNELLGKRLAVAHSLIKEGGTQ